MDPPMPPADYTHEEEEQIFQAVAALPAAEREAYYDSACAGRPTLRAAVERLLAFANEDEFMERAADRTETVEMAGEFARFKPEEAGEMIGPYKLLQRIGEGGFGIVWMAEQEKPVRRRVALKIIKLGMDTKEVIARFEQERQALAIMDHPNIARVIDAGATPLGRPYFAMELVRGVKITEYCDQANLSTVDRLRLFIAVCHAVQHAHQKGIIHRDLKPSNILVTLHDGVPVPKVIDFGVAKATQQQRLTDLTLFTQFEQMVGTPLYMSPEQAELSGLDIDTRSDIYSLGVLLYELLTGRTPFDPKELMKKGLDEMRRVIREQEPQKPSTFVSTMAMDIRTTVAQRRSADGAKLVGQIRGDLDWIVMKGLEKDRNRRYETASGFARDIERHLGSEPVQARPPSQLYRFRRFARRNKVVFGTSTLVAMAVFVGLAVSIWQAQRARVAEHLARQRLKETEAVSNYLIEIFRNANPDRNGRSITVAETLDRAAKRVEIDLADQPEARRKIYQVLGETYQALGLFRESIPLLEKVRDDFIKNLGPEHPDSIMAMTALAISYDDAGRRDESLQISEQVLSLYRKVLGPEHLDTINAMYNLAGAYNAVGRLWEAIKMQEDALAVARKVLGPEDALINHGIAQLANYYSDAGREAEAIKMYEEVQAFCRKFYGPNHPETLKAVVNVSGSYFSIGRRDEAVKMLEQVLPIYRQVFGSEHQQTLIVIHNLATYYHDGERFEQALAMREEELTLCRKANGAEHPATVRAQGALAASYFRAGRRDEAVKMQEEVLALYRKVSGTEHPETLMAMTGLANFYFKSGKREEALKLAEEALPLGRRVNGAQHPMTVIQMRDLANIYYNLGRREEGLKLAEEALALSRQVNGSEHPDTLSALQDLATNYSEAGHPDKGLPLYKEALTLYRKVLGPEDRKTLRLMVNLSLCYHKSGLSEKAVENQREAVALIRKVFGEEHAETIRTMVMLGMFHDEAGRYQEAIEQVKEALALSQSVSGPEDSRALDVMDSLKDLYVGNSRWKDAADLLQRLVDAKGSAACVELAPVLIMAHDSEAYRALCQHALTAFRESKEKTDLERAAKICCLSLSDDMDLGAAHAMAAKSLALGKGDEGFLPWGHLAMGWADYRLGNFKDAVTSLEKVGPKGPKEVQASSKSILAMALQHLGQKERARTTLRDADTLLGNAFAQPEGTRQISPEGGIWGEWLIARIAYREAKEFLDGTMPVTPRPKGR